MSDSAPPQGEIPQGDSSQNASDADNDILSLPIQFLRELSDASSVTDITNIVALWFSKVFHADRASITLLENEAQLTLISIDGNQAIPAGTTLPVEGTMIGRVVLSGKTEYCKDLSSSNDIDCKLLIKGNILSCLDAPLRGGGVCFGTINVGRSIIDGFASADQKKFEAMAHLISTLMHVHRQADQLRKFADLDPLTGLMNRRSFIRRFHSRLLEKDIQQGVGVALIDIDHFKKVNDTYGHEAGDKTLIQFCNALSRIFRQDDLLARFGGEEFCLVAIEVSEYDFRIMLTRFLQVLRDMPTQTDQGPISITASIGALHIKEPASNFNDIYQRIDKALYRAKHNGRDQVEF